MLLYPRVRSLKQQNNQQVDQAAVTELAQVDLHWQHKSEWFLAQWVHDTLGHEEIQHINGFINQGHCHVDCLGM